ncbi:hypothetical protein [Nocardia transvalensis]|uniref:hypothetical protein n=1 Tax=Nocardia transvalensis TaxID=37333 RepID=UPI001893F21A|nr:hypothetical protein [Nocardia transvalensis]MBF6327537.1 hypothetical protein [Nocardia transvalensis]
MTDLEAYTEKLRRAGEDTAAVRDLLHDIAAEARTAMSGLIPACGDDEFGNKFRCGEEGFESVMNGVIDGTAKSGDSWGQMSKGQYDAAKELERREQDSTDRLRQV